MKRSELSEMPAYFDRYIYLCDDVELVAALQTSINEIDAFPIEKWQKLGNKTYAEGKWTVKDILQHLIDTERIFCFRALAFARNESQTLPSFSEDDYALAAQSNNRSIESLVEELRACHIASLLLFSSFSEDMLLKKGLGFKGHYSVASIGFILAGHQRWHMKVLEHKYYDLL